jgi:hypothetical protein
MHTETDPLPPTTRSAFLAQPLATDERDAWLEDVRRWYYGGMEPSGDEMPDGSDDLPSDRGGPRPTDAEGAQRT